MREELHKKNVRKVTKLASVMHFFGTASSKRSISQERVEAEIVSALPSLGKCSFWMMQFQKSALDHVDICETLLFGGRRCVWCRCRRGCLAIKFGLLIL